jgi:hypothetical protein
MKKQAPQNTALGWLGNDVRGAGVLATARLHLEVQRVASAALPPALGAVCQVARLESDKLQLSVPSAAHAAKLRQMAPRIAQALARAGWNLNEITVKVQAERGDAAGRAVNAPKEAIPLNETALDAFQELHEQLRPGPLADAVARLLRRHRESG